MKVTVPVPGPCSMAMTSTMADKVTASPRIDEAGRDKVAEEILRQFEA